MRTDTTFAPHPDVVFRDLQGEAVILHLGTGTYFGLDEVGTRAWQLLAEYNTLSAVCGRLADEFDAPPDQIERDLKALVDQLLARDLIRASS